MGGDSAEEKAFRTKLSKKLRQMLPASSDTTLFRFLDDVLDAEPSIPKSIEKLLSESCNFHEIHLALVYCRNAQLLVFRSAPDFHAAEKQVLANHDRYVSVLMNVVEADYKASGEALQAELLREGRAHILSRARNEWGHEMQINVFNYYKEMPVSKPLTLLHVGEADLTVEKSRELISIFAASEHGSTALTRLPHTNLCVELRVEETTGKTVHLGYGEFIPTHREKRREIRVQSDQPMAITVKDANGQAWKGKVFDFSASGLGITFQSETTLKAGDEIDFSTALRGRKMKGKANVAWAENHTGYGRIGVMLDYDQENHLRLENEVRHIEKLLKTELKMRGIPDAFL